MKHSKPANSAFDIHPLIKDRWSPRSFDDRPISEDELNSLLEAMRWAPSSMNEQPWLVVYSFKGEEGHEDLGQLLMEGNSWARKAPLLLFTFVKTTFDRNGKTNHSAKHDLGLAIGNLSIQATSMGLSLHQMGGIHVDQIKSHFNLAEDVEPVSAIAIGYVGDPDKLDEPLKARELAERKRKPIEEFAFHQDFKK